MMRKKLYSRIAVVVVVCFILGSGIMPVIAFSPDISLSEKAAGSGMSLLTGKAAGYQIGNTPVLPGKGTVINELTGKSSIQEIPVNNPSIPEGEDGVAAQQDELQPGTKATGSGGQAPAGMSGKSALLDAIAGRTTPPVDQAIGISRSVSGEGMVHFIESDGGFFGIITPDGEKYRPGNLPNAMRVEGTRIRFVGVAKVPAPGSEGWGTPLSLISITTLIDQISGSGTVKYIGIEGGFFGIITQDGRKYLPLNLPKEFQVDGILVTFTAREKTDVATIFMWGTPVELDSIDSLGRLSLPLEGSWSLMTCDGHSLNPGTMISAEFGPDGKVTGTTGCNQYVARYTATGSGLRIGTVGSTKMYCSSPEGIMEQEQEYFALLAMSASWTMINGNLVIHDSQEREILVFSLAITDEPAPLIEYFRTGGVAGLDDHLLLFANGSGTVTRRGISQSVKVPQPVMADLISHITAADFPTLKEHYPAQTEGADYFTYTLTSGGRTVVTEDTGVPPILVPIINTLNDIVTNGRMSLEYRHTNIPNFF